MHSRTLLALLQLPGISAVTAAHILPILIGAEYLNAAELVAGYGVAARQGTKRKLPPLGIQDAQQALDQADRTLESCAAHGITVLNPDDQAFPSRLLTIPQRPLLLYAKGNLAAMEPRHSIAFIGTRHPTDAAQVDGYELTATLTEARMTIVSGLALGCDTVGHRACLDAGGQTIAVLPSGFDHIFPKENVGLAAEIVEKGGCLLSEYPPDAKSQSRYFIERDRLQSGLADAVVVLETDVKGGTMHTVSFAEKQGRILACWVPQNGSYEARQGNQLLLQQGRAMPLSNKEDVESLLRKVGL